MPLTKYISKDIGAKLVRKMEKRQDREFDQQLQKYENQFRNISNDLDRDILATYRKLQLLRSEREQHDQMVEEKKQQIWETTRPELQCGSPIQYHRSEWMLSILLKNFKTKLTKDQSLWASFFKTHWSNFQKSIVKIKTRQNFYYKRANEARREANCFIRLKTLEKTQGARIGGA